MAEKKYMIIDGIRAEFTDEKIFCRSFIKWGFMYRLFVTIRICPFMVPAVCVW